MGLDENMSILSIPDSHCSTVDDMQFGNPSYEILHGASERGMSFLVSKGDFVYTKTRTRGCRNGGCRLQWNNHQDISRRTKHRTRNASYIMMLKLKFNQSQCSIASIISQKYIIWPVMAACLNLTTMLAHAGPMAGSCLFSFHQVICTI